MGRVITIRQTKQQKKRAIEAKKKGHKSIGFKELESKIRKSGSASNPKAVAGSILAKQRKQFGTRVVQGKTKIVYEPAI